MPALLFASQLLLICTLLSKSMGMYILVLSQLLLILQYIARSARFPLFPSQVSPSRPTATSSSTQRVPWWSKTRLVRISSSMHRWDWMGWDGLDCPSMADEISGGNLEFSNHRTIAALFFFRQPMDVSDFAEGLMNFIGDMKNSLST